MSQFPQLNEVNEKNPLVTVHTNLGDFTLELFPEVAPKTVEKFRNTCEKWILQRSYLPPCD